jgi:hypothetical protein
LFVIATFRAQTASARDEVTGNSMATGQKFKISALARLINRRDTPSHDRYQDRIEEIDISDVESEAMAHSVRLRAASEDLMWFIVGDAEAGEAKTK